MMGKLLSGRRNLRLNFSLPAFSKRMDCVFQSEKPTTFRRGYLQHFSRFLPLPSRQILLRGADELVGQPRGSGNRMWTTKRLKAHSDHALTGDASGEAELDACGTTSSAGSNDIGRRIEVAVVTRMPEVIDYPFVIGLARACELLFHELRRAYCDSGPGATTAVYCT